MSKIGILGGTFNPIHNGHIKLATSALNELNLDRVWFMPSKNPPHKNKNDIASDYHRVNMIQLAIKHYKDFELSILELERNGTTYTSDTFLYLKENYPQDVFYFILGTDSLFNIEKWHRPDILFNFATFVVALRDNVMIEELNNHCDYLKKKYDNVRIEILNMLLVDVSSTDIRDVIEHKDTATNRYANVSPDVGKYIELNKIYSFN